MLYDAYQAQQDFLAPLRAGADLFKSAFGDTNAGPAANYWLRSAAAGAEVFSRLHMIHERPAFGIEAVTVAGRSVPVIEDVALELPFCWPRRWRGTSRPCCATPPRHCWRTMTSTSPIGRAAATCR
jgi:poly-beta-hydroxyalkanoate depolymerase